MPYWIITFDVIRHSCLSCLSFNLFHLYFLPLPPHLPVEFIHLLPHILLLILSYVLPIVYIFSYTHSYVHFFFSFIFMVSLNHIFLLCPFFCCLLPFYNMLISAVINVNFLLFESGLTAHEPESLVILKALTWNPKVLFWDPCRGTPGFSHDVRVGSKMKIKNIIFLQILLLYLLIFFKFCWSFYFSSTNSVCTEYFSYTKQF